MAQNWMNKHFQIMAKVYAFTFTLSLSNFHFQFQTFTFTRSLSHFHFHTSTVTLSEVAVAEYGKGLCDEEGDIQLSTQAPLKSSLR